MLTLLEFQLPQLVDEAALRAFVNARREALLCETSAEVDGNTEEERSREGEGRGEMEMETDRDRGMEEVSKFEAFYEMFSTTGLLS